MQNKPNFPHFSAKNDDLTKKQTQFKPNSNPIKANFGPEIRGANPIQTQTNPNFCPLLHNTVHSRGANPITSMAKNECFCVDKNPNDNILLFSRENLPLYKGAKMNLLTNSKIFVTVLSEH
jgi:hypothetical protein